MDTAARHLASALVRRGHFQASLAGRNRERLQAAEREEKQPQARAQVTGAGWQASTDEKGAVQMTDVLTEAPCAVTDGSTLGQNLEF